MHKEQAQRQKGLPRISQPDPEGYAELVFEVHSPGPLVPGMAKEFGKVVSAESSPCTQTCYPGRSPRIRLSQQNPPYPRTMPRPSLSMLLSGWMGGKQPSHSSPHETVVILLWVEKNQHERGKAHFGNSHGDVGPQLDGLLLWAGSWGEAVKPFTPRQPAKERGRGIELQPQA